MNHDEQSVGRHPRLRFLQHAVEMVVAMVAGMVLLEPVWSFAWPGLHGSTPAHVLVMATNMSLGMAVWMRVRDTGRRRSPRWPPRCTCRSCCCCRSASRGPDHHGAHDRRARADGARDARRHAAAPSRVRVVSRVRAFLRIALLALAAVALPVALAPRPPSTPSSASTPRAPTARPRAGTRRVRPGPADGRRRGRGQRRRRVRHAGAPSRSSRPPERSTSTPWRRGVGLCRSPAGSTSYRTSRSTASRTCWEDRRTSSSCPRCRTSAGRRRNPSPRGSPARPTAAPCSSASATARP